MIPELITYRLGEKNFCYIPPPKTYEVRCHHSSFKSKTQWYTAQDAIQAAKTNYKELKDVDPSRFTFCIIAVVAGQRQHIRISPSSWPIVLTKLRRYEVLDILVEPDTLPDIIVHSATDIDSLPTYEDIREKSGTDDFLAPSRHPSPQVKSIPLETIRAVQRYPRRTPSPARSSPSRSSSPSSSLTDLARSIFGRSSPQ